ncbi:hypothetical protein EON77_16035, partial [bacterium]
MSVIAPRPEPAQRESSATAPEAAALRASSYERWMRQPQRRSGGAGAALARAARAVGRGALDALPPLLTVAALVGLWEVACSSPTASLPPPSRVIEETWELIVDPFFDHGGIDKGLFWHILASLRRVALGYS